VAQLCRDGAADVPVYDIPTSRCTGRHRLVGGAPVFIAEGVFAGGAGRRAAAYAITDEHEREDLRRLVEAEAYVWLWRTAA
jgi:hypothetical protein